MNDNPIVIKDYQNPYETVRQNWQKDQNKKIIGNDKFSFNKFLTDKEKATNYKKYGTTTYNKRQQDTQKDKDDHIIQPPMRYKPRTDFERVVDGINENRGHVDPKIVASHLRKRNLTNIKRKARVREMLDEPKKKKQDDSDTSSSEEFYKKKEETQENKVMKKKVWRMMKNPEAKKVLKEYHEKTYFKGASVFTITSGNKGYIKVKSAPQVFSLHREVMKRVNEMAKEKKHITLQNEDLLTNNTNPPKFNVPEKEDLDVISLNPLIYGLTAESRHVDRSAKNEDNTDVLRKLKKLAFNYDNDDDAMIKSKNIMSKGVIRKIMTKNKKKKNLAEIKEEEKIKIDGVYYSKSEITKISNLILRKCNFIQPKKREVKKGMKRV